MRQHKPSQAEETRTILRRARAERNIFRSMIKRLRRQEAELSADIAVLIQVLEEMEGTDDACT
jgi:predicted nucleotidyltransferase